MLRVTLKDCLALIVRNVPIYKRQSRDRLYYSAIDDALDSYETLDSSSMESAVALIRIFSQEYAEAQSIIRACQEVLFDYFTTQDGQSLRYDELYKAFESLPSDEARHLLILAIKEYGLSLKVSKANKGITAIDVVNEIARTGKIPRLSTKRINAENFFHKLALELDPETLMSLNDSLAVTALLHKIMKPRKQF